MRAGPAARRVSPILDATDGATAPRGVKRANWILTVGLVLTSYRRHSANRGGRVSIRIASATARVVREAGSGRKVQVDDAQDAGSRDGETPWPRPRSSVVEALANDRQRSKPTERPRADDTRTNADPHSSSDPRFAYLTRSFD